MNYHNRNNIAFYSVLTVCLIITWLLMVSVNNQVKGETNRKFNSIVRQVVSAIEERMAIYIDAHYAGVGLLSAAQKINREVQSAEWREFVKAMHLVDRYPGINGLGHDVQVEKKDLKHFVNDVRDLDIENYEIKPPGDRPNYFAIKFIEPIENNLPALGFDMGSEAKRRAAMERARDTGKVTISPKITLVQDAARTPGFLSYVPLYRGGSIPASLEERREKFIGHVYAPFITQDFIDGIFALELAELRENIRLKVFNGSEPNDANLIYRSEEFEANEKLEGKLSKDVAINFYGQPWVIRVIASPSFFNTTGKYLAVFVLIVGLLLTSLLLLLISSLNKTKEKAEKLAEEMTVELNRKNKLLAQSNEELNTFASIASHDLKEPLRTVSNYIGMLTLELKKVGALHESSDENEKIKQYSDFILGACGRMRNLIDDLLEFSRVNRKVDHSSFKEIDTRKLLDQAVAEIGDRVNQRSAKIKIKDELPMVKANPTQLTRVFQNLISNAIKYCDKDPVVEISSSALENNSGYKFTIKDNGIGMDMQYRDQIFQLFKRLHGKEKYDGTGLGLAICKKIVEHHRGEIWVESEPGNGSEFSFTIKTNQEGIGQC